MSDFFFKQGKTYRAKQISSLIFTNKCKCRSPEARENRTTRISDKPRRVSRVALIAHEIKGKRETRDTLGGDLFERERKEWKLLF